LASFLFSLAMPVKPPSQAPNSVAAASVAKYRMLGHSDRRREQLQKHDTQQSGAQADRAADQSVANEIQGFQVVAGRDMALLEASRILGL